jgi:hypothetical protein
MSVRRNEKNLRAARGVLPADELGHIAPRLEPPGAGRR